MKLTPGVGSSFARRVLFKTAYRLFVGGSSNAGVRENLYEYNLPDRTHLRGNGPVGHELL